MKPFVFRLEALRKIRIRKEEEQQQQLAVATGSYKEALAGLNMLQQRLAQLQSAFEKQKQAGTTISMLAAYETYRVDLNVRIVRQTQAVQTLNEERLAALRRLEDAMKDRKAVEKLKAKRWEHYEELVLQEEQKLLDELASAVVQRYQGSDEI